jgi:hypothetical protein
MTTKAAFSPTEWQVVLEGPPTAALIVITSEHGGSFRETIALSKAYVEARAQHGESELLDEIVSEKPRMEQGRFHSPEELKDQGLVDINRAVVLLDHKATQQEREEYSRFVLTVANNVAAAHKEHGQSVSPQEAAAIEQITEALKLTNS